MYLIGTCAVSLLLTMLSLPLLWRRATTPWARLVYVFGVRGFGLGGGLLFSVLFSRYRAEGQIQLATWALQASLYFLIALPLWLWAGYLWGRSMAAALKVARTTDNSRP